MADRLLQCFKHRFPKRSGRRIILPCLILASALLLTLVRLFIPDYPSDIMRLLGTSPGLNLQKFDNEIWSGSPIGSGIVTRLNLDRQTSQFLTGNRFSILLTGSLYVPETGSYLFELMSDDGAQVYLNEEFLTADPGLHPMRSILKNKKLQSGWHSIRIKYFNRDADAGLRLSWRPPGGDQTVLDERYLFTEKAENLPSSIYRLLLMVQRIETLLILYLLAGAAAVPGLVRKTGSLLKPVRLWIRIHRTGLAGGCLAFVIFLMSYHLPGRNPIRHGFEVSVKQGPDREFMQRELNGTTGRFHSHTHRAVEFNPAEIELSGWLRIDTAGEYGFSLQARDSAVFEISDVEFLVSTGSRTPVTSRIGLSEGLHRISIHYGNRNLPACLDLKWAQPGSDRYRPVPARLLYRQRPSADDLHADSKYRKRLTICLALLVSSVVTCSLIRMIRNRRFMLRATIPGFVASFMFLFLLHVPLLRYDHQAGFRWFNEFGVISRSLIACCAFILASGLLSGPLRQVRSALKHHRAARFLLALILVSMTVLGRFLYQAATTTSQHVIPGLLFAATALLLIGTGYKPVPIRKPCVTGIGKSHLKLLALCALGVIVLWAAWVRFHRLHEMPPGLWWDEAQTGRVVRSIMEGDFPPVYDLRINAGTIASYLTTAWCHLTGTTDPWGLRSYTACVGVLTVIASWWMFRQLFSVFWSLFGMTLLAGSRWLFTINRTAMATIDETILLTILILASYIRTQRRNRIRDHVFTGLLLGLAMHLHTGARVLPVIIGVDILIRLSRFTGNSWKCRLRNAAILVICAVIAFAPMGMYIYDNMEDYLKRSRETLLSTEYPGWYPVRPYLDNIRYYLEMYVVRGDWHPRHNFDRTPQLAPVISIIAALGAFLSAGRSLRHPVHRLLLLGFCMVSLQGIMTVHMDGPNLNRVAENIPIVFSWAVFGAIFIRDGTLALFRTLFGGRGMAGSITAALLGIGILVQSTVAEYSIYFEKYLSWPALADIYGFQPAVTEMARIAREVIASDPDVRVWAMYAGGDPFQYVYPGDERLTPMSVEAPPVPEPGRPMVLLFPSNESAMRELLRKKFPHAVYVDVKYSLNDQISLVTIMKVDFSGQSR